MFTFTLHHTRLHVIVLLEDCIALFSNISEYKRYSQFPLVSFDTKRPPSKHTRPTAHFKHVKRTQKGISGSAVLDQEYGSSLLFNPMTYRQVERSIS